MHSNYGRKRAAAASVDLHCVYRTLDPALKADDAVQYARINETGISVTGMPRDGGADITFKRPLGGLAQATWART
ncbi:MAG: hypothetical protein GKR94_07320 [Gammaproteobacteria bacterium]|nr:hypothetical protein [Gammaproteobacteria bacterium]